MRFLSASLATAVALCASALAQFTVVTPNGYSATAGNSNNIFPWGEATTSMRYQQIYDSSHFTLQSVAYPILISQLRFRTSTLTATFAGGSWPNVQINFATSPVDFLAASTTFANNQGPDLTTVYNGPVTVVGGTSGVGNQPWYITIPLTTPFLYNPLSGGDLTLEVLLTGTGWTGTSTACDAVSGTGAGGPVNCTRIYSAGSTTSATGSVGLNYGLVTEFTYSQATGLYAGFSATPTAGASPLFVQFTDHTFTSDPGGVTSWAWDFNGDSVIDSTLQNPSFTYGSCGSYTVALTVTDASHSPSTLTRTNYIVTDNTTPSFTFTALGSNTVQFTDTTTPAATSWAWDFNGDNVVDSTLQNPVWVYAAGCTRPNVSLTVNRLCRGPFSLTAPAPGSGQCTALLGGNGNTSTTYVGNMFDVVVNNPQGIAVCQIDVAPYSFAGAFTCDVYVTPGTYVGNNLNAAVWRKVATGTGTTNAGGFSPPTMCSVPLATSFYLPPGNYGMAVYLSRSPLAAVNIAYTNGPVGPFGNADITFVPNPGTAPGIATLALFTGSTTPSRVWNGVLHYSTTSSTGEAGYGFFGPGCAGTLGIPGNTASNLPKLGQTMVANLSGLNMNAAFFILGFSRTSSIFGPLPFSLTPYGAPGCFGRVSTDSAVLITGVGNTAAFSLTIPNNAIYLGNQLYTQGLALDTVNALGAVTSDAAAFIVGQ